MIRPAEAAPPDGAEKGPAPPTISLPKGGGAIRGIGEKFAANPVTGTGSLSVPIPTSPGRSGFGPRLSLSYDSGAGNGPFGFGWRLSLPSITRKTDKGLPRYRDTDESDVFVLSGAEDLVPLLVDPEMRTIEGIEHRVQRYRPRIEGLFSRVERWTNLQTGVIHWRSITRDNVVTLYGKDNKSRIFDPGDPDPEQPTRIFTWLICESYDDKGNAVIYEYAAENTDHVDLSQAHERNRTPSSRAANRYLKRIKYGNRVSRLVQPDLSQTEWMFEVVFDYGEHDAAAPMPNDAGTWLCRNDPFSTYRAGFEARTYRLCQRVLMFHHFSAEPGVGQDCLVRSTDFVYRDIRDNPDDLKRGHPIASFIASVTQHGYKRNSGGYLKKSMPPVELEYSRAVIQEEIRELDAASLENLPNGLDGARYQWVDLDGEGISGILTEQANGWFYKRNHSPVHVEQETVVACFAPVELVAHRPSPASVSTGLQQFLDLAGDGQIDLVQFQRPLSGFYERTQDGTWSPFIPFASAPILAWNDPNLKFIDLTGDGHADVLVSEHSVFTWYPSLGEKGFGAAEQVAQALDDEKGPRLLFADGTQSIYLADMSGDGLTDLVRVRNGEVCYWPNLGYGRFGARVAMDDAPWFDRPELFDQRHVRLADIDGSGVTDILYLGRDGVRVCFNQSGNRWSEPQTLAQVPPSDSLSSATVVDLLGNGTACLVWSSPLPGNVRRAMRYVDLMGGQKPHLLVGVKNNLGAETRMRYAPSTKFYLEDKLAGKPWITRLPFPVHVVERVETFDRISHNRFVTRYAYHHGCFDGTEREFRGFGMVEQWDTEEIGSVPDDETSSAATHLDAASFVPPIHTRTWFHTGIGLGCASLLLEETMLPPGLTPDEEREACRALKGLMLRQEIYGLDGTDKAQHPYTVTEQNFTIERLQPRAANRHAVFFTHAREALSYHYERNPDDPRISHAMILEVDEYGNVLKSVAIAYGRKQSPLPEHPEQTRTLITCTETSTTNAIDDADHPDDYHVPLPSEVRTLELTGYAPADAAVRFQISDFLSPGAIDEIEYEEPATAGRQHRLIERVRTIYRKDDLSGFLPLGDLEPGALPGQSYKLAFTPGLLAMVYKRKLGNAPEENLLPDPAQVLGGKGAEQGGYVDLDANGQWWIPSARLFYGTTADAAVEWSEARQHFFLPRRFTDPFDHTTTVDYDTHDLLVVKTEDAVHNTVTALHDYRVLQSRQMTDPNGNRSEAAFDALGMVVGMAVMGKAAGPVEGDSFDTFATDLTPQQIQDYFDAANPRPLAIAHLGTATTRILYDFDRVPACAASIARETHVSDLAPGEQTRVQLSFVYSDGFGREAQTKVQAEPGLLDPNDPASPLLDPRWVGTGTKIYNNKGKLVRQYEPFFSPSHHLGIEQHGVSSTLFYDPAERIVATLHPNHTWEKIVFDPWQQVIYDVNDTVRNADGSTDPKSDEDVKGFFSRLPDADYLPTWYEQRIVLAPNHPERMAADKTAVHRQTPTVVHLDTLGRTFLTIAHNRCERDGLIVEEMYPARVELDIEGNQREVVDAKDRVVLRCDYDMLGNRVHQASMEAGERWMLNDVAGKPLYAWDSRDHRFRTAYDGLRRPTDTLLREGAGAETVVGRIAYGESQPNPEASNLRGKAVELRDQAGVVTSDDYDFKGNLRQSRRQLAQEYKALLSWSGAVPLQAETFTSRTRHDALNRPIQLIAPRSDQPGTAVNVIQPLYNEANLLEQVNAWLDQSAEPAILLDPATANLHAVTGIDYDAKGQRELIAYGNGAVTIYDYDPLTFRLVRLVTRRHAADFPADCPQPPPAGWPGCQVQDLCYTYDAAGNITSIRDDAQQAIHFKNKRIEPSAEYTYDAIYRLIEATGREHLGQAGGTPIPHSYNDAPRAGLLHPGDGNAMGRYLERYVYDAVGNFCEIQHRGSDPANPGWNRVYAYDEASALEPARQSNRLTGSTIGGITEACSIAGDGYDAHGNMLRLPQLAVLQWSYKDQLQMIQRQKVNDDDADGVARHGERTWYVYDAAGQRVRKVTERANNGGLADERIYLGGFEIYRRHAGADAGLVRETLHIMDGKRRIALVETRNDVDDGTAEQLVRYQCGNHLGSTSLELDEQAQIISYEEHTPYGSTSYQAVRSQTETPKRYRYTGKERDEESGFYYHGARYYAPWLGRWITTDPAGLVDGSNLYAYVKGSPVDRTDPSGTDTKEMQ
ncbi:MAG: SpvB/TcaC N-terminal domain-containing protein, partial [Myxococcales bacterium]